MEYLKPLGGGAMDRKELLLKLCQKLYDAVDYLYGESSGLKAHLGEVLGRYGSVLSDIGWVLTWANEEVQDEVFRIIEDGFKRYEEHRIKCALEEWLRWKLSDVVNEALHSEEETEYQPPQTDELPF
jgi:hypothetical protein